MKRILATTALVAVTAVPAFAQTETTTATDDAVIGHNEAAGGMFDLNGMQFSADEMIGRTVYAGSDAANATTAAAMDAPADDWENVGSVNDVIFGADGSIDAVVLDIGGFLGIGAREISLTMDEVTLVNDTSSDDAFFVVYNGSAAELEERPETDRDSVTQQGSTFQSTAPMAPTTAQDTAPATGADDLMQEGAQAPQMADDITPVDPADTTTAMDDDAYLSGEALAALTADDLLGANVYDMSDENVGSINDIVLTADGQVSDVIVDVGGFLGIGARSVALSFDDLQIAHEEGGMTSSIRVWTQVSEAQLENMPEWTGDN